MTDASSRLSLPSFLKAGLLNRTGTAGPRRLIAIAGVGICMLALLVGISMIRYRPPPQSQVAKMPPINPLPGGLQSNPEQDALALRAAQEAADKALQIGHSYTPPMPASQPLQPLPVAEQAPTAPPVPSQPARRGPAVAQATKPVAVPAAFSTATTSAPVQQAVAPDPQELQRYRAATQLFQNWENRAPRTDVVLPATQDSDTQDPPGAKAPGNGRNTQAAASPTSVSATARAGAESDRVLVPAGRGIWGHSVLAVNSDTLGPLILQADSGPIAGDRMTASFTKNGYDRLVIRVTAVEHRGRTIEANGIVVAPDTMETAVASSVDEHYLERFLLPAAAAFVQGLGQAFVASNTTSSISPLTGTVSGFTKLNLGQQMGVAAGAAAQQVGSALSQEAPKGPTINLAANANVGVVFLSNLNLPE